MGQPSKALLGGPVGITLLAAFAFYEFANSVVQARVELVAGLGPLDDYRKSLEGLTGAQIAVRRLDIEIEIDDAQGEIERLQGGLEEIQRTLSQGFTGYAEGSVLLRTEDIEEFNNELLRGQADIDLYTQRIQELQARLDALAFQGPIRPELAPQAADDPSSQDAEAREKARERSLTRLAGLAEAADNRIAASALSRIDQITRREEIGCCLKQLNWVRPVA